MHNLLIKPSKPTIGHENHEMLHCVGASILTLTLKGCDRIIAAGFFAADRRKWPRQIGTIKLE